MQKRNNTVDIIRGFAMLLVVLGHTMSGSTSDFQDSLLFQIIWTLQMPLFIIISGYVTRYSRPITDGTGLLKFFKKRSLAYLLPWVVWTLVVRAGIFGQTQYYDAEFLLWHTDSGYWFLLTIWTIAMVFGIADMLSNKIAKEKNTLNILLHFAFCGIGMIILGVIGYLLGLSFLGIKLTLYYLPMYLMGYLYGQLQEGLLAKKYGRTAINWSIAICLGIWLALINRIDFYGGADGGLFILLRFANSVMGCVAVIGLFTSADFREVYLAMGRSSFSRNLPHALSVSQPPQDGRIASNDNSERNGSDGSELCVNAPADRHSNQTITEECNAQLSAVCETYSKRFLKWVGVHSLEVYLIHGFSLCLLRMPKAPAMGSLESWWLIFINFIIAVVLSCTYIRIIETNKLLNKILYWK